ncbi:uncharacterized protein LOC131996725 [Stomoxys calcitrans]|uniref:uncharacterized protein LOC131996725 n=1 Tax=Stomoxys calcitrans TaxID=35570 RepID=UPI0027E2F643|nr:uncharacterized protein LOC131996725 [Stomoxys calcitrans]
MSTLDRFIRANIKLVHFEQELTDASIENSSVFALEVHREELRSIWGSVKSLYEKCVDEVDQKAKKKGKDGTDPLSSSDVSDETHMESINARYHASYETYVKIVSKISAGIHDRGRNTSSLPPSPFSITPHSNFHLPACDTETFCGDYKSWPSFRDMFSAIYVNNSSLSNVQKLFYLMKKTEGEAHDIVMKGPLTNSGFDTAWANLVDRFENKRMLVHSQLRVLFNLSPVKSENGEDIKCLQRDINSCISSLQMYHIDISSWDPIFVYICSTKLPRTTLSLWEHSIQNKKDISNWSDLNNFLSSRFQTLETISEINCQSSSHDSRQTGLRKSSQNVSKQINSNHTNVSATPAKHLCNLCSLETHIIRKCPKFIQMCPEERLSCIRKLNLCLNCFAGGHSVKECKSSHNCFTCKKRHNTLLHRDATIQVAQYPNTNAHAVLTDFDPDTSIIQSTSLNPTETYNAVSESVACSPTSLNSVQSCFASHTRNVLLGTALVQIRHSGLTYIVRALIDSGSQGTFLSEKIFHTLKIPFQRIDAEITGLNGVPSATVRKLAKFTISPRFDSQLEMNVTALVIPQLSRDLPSRSINPSTLNLFNNILLDGVKRDICGSLVAQETIFGWIVSGSVQNTENISSFSSLVSFLSEKSLEKTLRRFWEVENLPRKQHLSEDDEFCEKLYKETTTRDESGRFTVGLPFKHTILNSTMQLGQSRTIAKAQFLRNESRLLKNLERKNEYDAVVEEYLDLGHMKSVPAPIHQNYPQHYYLPHHSVVKPESTTTKVRVVFNASCPTSSGVSLNDILHTGPALQNDLVLLLLRWRFYRFVFCADIQKMYRQIKVHPKDTCYQRILFRRDPCEEISDYELTTVTFGVNAAPYLAIRTLLQLAEESERSLPIASEIIRDSMYVDDVIAGSHHIPDALSARTQLIIAMSSAHFPLRKWASNCIEILAGLPKDHLLKEDFLSFDDSSHTKTLGIRWNAKSDNFFFRCNAISDKLSYTKREVLSEISKIFDPAGWLAPIIVLTKILMRKIWLSNVGWDESINSDCLHDWKRFLSSYSLIDTIQLPRWLSYSPSCHVQFHAFCDASENAYATVIYTRILLEDDSVYVALLTSKSKVAPVNTLSIPRLELCGATLLAELVDSVIPSMHLPSYEIYKWTDSTIVLAWLRKPSCYWKVFVANRVSTITELVGIDNWFHVESESNPADLVSRGVYPEDLVACNLWWNGPQWLQLSPEFWPVTSDTAMDTQLEQKPIAAHISILPEEPDLLERFSSFNRYSRSEHASTSHSTHAMLPHQRITVLPTAIIKIAWKNRLYPVRALIDTGSAVSRIAKAIVTKHHLLTSRMGESEMCQIVFRAHSGNTTKISMCARVDNRISMVTPISTLSMAFKEKFLNLVLADPDFLESNPISIVLGADIYPKLILSGVIPTGEGSLMAQNSTLGWLVSGTCAA